MKIDISSEIVFQTARSGGKGGQNVNKVETMVEGRWNISSSALLNDEEKSMLIEKLNNRITADGDFLIKSQAERTQLGNKREVIRKMNDLVNRALIKKKLRKPTKPSKEAKAKRIENKRIKSMKKELRRRPNRDDY